MNEFPLPIRSDYFVLCVNTNNKNKKLNTKTIMTWITEKEEEKIDNIKGTHVRLERGNRVFTITEGDIYCYGEVDFEDTETLDIIENFNFLNFLDFGGLWMYSRYNYHTHSCRSPKRFPLMVETWSPSTIAKFAHGTLDKPKRIILFKE